MRFAAPVSLLLAACGLDTLGTSPPPERERPQEGPDEEPPESPAAPVTPGPTPELSVMQTPITDTVDLTAEGVIDWVHWGSSTFNRHTGGDAIADYTTSPQWTREFASSTSVVFAWSDGTPKLQESGTSSYSYLNDADNLSATIAVRASRKPRVARFYVGGKDSHVRFAVRLVDGSAPPPPPIDIDQTGSFLVRLVTRFAAASDDTKLEIVGMLISRRLSDSSVRIAAATLAER
jgi:hypothetical protein